MIIFKHRWKNGGVHVYKVVGGITGFIPDAITTIICIAIQIKNRGF